MSIRARTWTALLLPPVSWFVFEQGLSALLHAHCGQAPIGLVWGCLSLVLCAVAARIAWPLAKPSDASADRWLALGALTVAGFFGLAIVFQTLAVLLVPACVR